MTILLHPFVIFSLTGFPLFAVCLDPVPVQLDKTSVLVTSGQDTVFTLQTVSNASLIRWTNAGETTLAMWANGQPLILPVPEYQGRISVTATQFRISNTKLRDSGNYTVSVEPSPTSGLGVNTRSVQLKVFDAVDGVSLSLPKLPLEAGNVSLGCSWSVGTEVSVVWGKGGAALTSDSRITISAGSLLISPARRDDAGEYTCTVSNAVSARTAKANLSVYYGPDAPQLNKTSSECVGGGDAALGQTIRLDCTSASLPPASFSWEFNGQPVTAGQSGSGVLNLQIFSTNQSGRYTCTARNDVTGATSKQQMDVVIVGTCLSAAAVAGIVMACVVVLIIIIIVIILLLRQRRVDQRIKEALELQKTNRNNSNIVLASAQNANTAYRAPVNANGLDPALHNSQQQNNHNSTFPINSNGNINPLQHNGHLPTEVFQHNLSALSNNGHPNTHPHPNNGFQNSRSFPQPSQPNPNILIQTGSSQPGALAPTVHVNLNTLPNTDQHNNAQPHTVHVNLNSYPQEAGQPSLRHADQINRTLQRQNANANHLNSSQTGLLNSDFLSLDNQAQAGVDNVLSNGSRQPNGLIQTSYSHSTDRTNTNRRPNNSRLSTEEQPQRSNHVQMPWDRLRGTPAYPNRQVDSLSDSDSSESPPRSPRQDARRGRSGSVRRVSERADGLNLPASAAHGRDIQRAGADMERRNISTRPQVQSQSQIAPRHAVTQAQNPQGQNVMHINLPQRTTIPYPAEAPDHPQAHAAHPQAHAAHPQAHAAHPQAHAAHPQAHAAHPQGHAAHPQAHAAHPQGHAAHPQAHAAHPQAHAAHPQAHGARPDHMLITAQPSIPLTQEVLRQHTIQTDNPFTNRIQQTQALLQNPGAPSRPSQPIQQLSKAGQRPPTPPPVLRPTEFQSMPRERMQQTRNLQPAHVISQPVHAPHRHRPPNAQRQTTVWHTSPQRVAGFQPMHATMHGHPKHAKQVHRGRPRR